ncbi:hypothetical protein TNCV_4649231 [Trichonephila clavipes]|uniref:Uncharacterized protein n=1 Tax=Trichonephila clavipes TaxID=2585209 RepID=A0A8X6SUM7_TRICX|nr:hypothetical protein TNCV_4649231 [Trichonephila clavipes]
MPIHEDLSPITERNRTRGNKFRSHVPGRTHRPLQISPDGPPRLKKKVFYLCMIYFSSGKWQVDDDVYGSLEVGRVIDVEFRYFGVSIP